MCLIKICYLQHINNITMVNNENKEDGNQYELVIKWLGCMILPE